MKRLILFLLPVWILAFSAPVEADSPDMGLILEKMRAFKDVRFLVTPTLYDRLSPEDLKAFGKGQVLRLEVPFDTCPAPSKLYWRTAFLLDPGKKLTLQFLKNLLDYNKQSNGRPEPDQEWKDAQGGTAAYFYPIRNADVLRQRNFWAFYDSDQAQHLLSQTLSAWFLTKAEGDYQFFVQGAPVTVQVAGKTVKDQDHLRLEVNEYPILIYSTCPYDPKGVKKTQWPQSTVTFKDPSEKVHPLDADCLVSYGVFCGVDGNFYSTAKPQGKPIGRHKVAFLDVTSEGDFGAPGPVMSARWKGEFYADEEGTYGFRVETQDHASLTIDGQPVLTAPKMPEGSISLTKGVHKLSLVYRRQAGASAPPQLHLLSKTPKSKDFGLFVMSKKSWNYK